MGDIYIGLISGTSMDGIDAALVSIEKSSLDVLQTHQHDYPAELRRQLTAAKLDASIRTLDDVADLHRQVGECFRDAANQLLADSDYENSAVAAIGSHGQTIRHEPDIDDPYSLQIGDANIIAGGTGITTIADFRSADIALGGQGAPLAPAFHEWLFDKDGCTRVVLNLGGIANITVLHGGDAPTTGFDTGPANTLMDAWIARHRDEPFDSDGSWAAQGNVNPDLLAELLADSYFSSPPPKSTGFEYFNLEWLDAAGVDAYDPADVQATLCALTAASVAAAVKEHASGASDLFACGGGVHNSDLMRRLDVALPGTHVRSTASAGLDPDWVEAAAFAWLAMRNTKDLPGNLASVTGARHSVVLGRAFSVVR
ncbi:MAG: anhydro-N-acetylmuramic acid kinase [Gammaproteobacteria bacterium]|nr:anhydro-N-acetylmuramic acid kinase [Gammaproteobacteria bacterium]